MRYDFEILTGVEMRIQVYLYAFENRAGNLITGISRTNRMDAHSGQYIPCRHLPNIFVSAQSQNIVTISFITNLSRPLLCQPRARRVIEKEWYMMVWFIRMIIIIIPQKSSGTLAKNSSNSASNFFCPPISAFIPSIS